jgi:methionyl-tRNA synthetase
MGKQNDRTQPHAVNQIIYNTAESLRIAGILLQPFMPEKAGLLLDMLGVADTVDKRNINAATYGFDADYGVPRAGLGKGRAGTLFPPLISGEE